MSTASSETDLKHLVADMDTGGRNPSNTLAKSVLLCVALLWSLFQLWYASPLPFLVGPVVLNSTQARSIHLAFAIFLAFSAYPAFKGQRRDTVPAVDWLIAAVAAFCAAYQFLFYDTLSGRVGVPTWYDQAVAATGLVLLLEATRRALGPALMVVALVFLGYVFFGDADIVPGTLQWKGASFGKAMWHQWLQTEGVFGVPLGVSTSFVFLFVLFGSLLERAGAGNYFIQIAFALLGHMRGGPAKAAVVSSGLTGLISGSSIANVVTTGTFTVPLMRKVGFSREKAGAVEVASSVNGQLMPPVMGAAAFLMVEYVGIPYFQVIKHAFLPAVISYVALLYMVHLEALKGGMEGLPRRHPPKPLVWTLLSTGLTLASIAALAGGMVWLFELAGMLAQGGNLFWGAIAVVALQALVYLGVRRAVPAESRWRVISGGALVLGNVVLGAAGVYGLVQLLVAWTGPAAVYVIAALVLAVYVALVAVSTRVPELAHDIRAYGDQLPDVGLTLKAGLHYLPPVGVLVWALMVERLSPSLAAFWAAAFMVLILLTQRPLRALFLRSGDILAATRRGGVELLHGLVTGARNMIGIGVATAAAGIIVGTVTLTGVGQVMTAFVETLSGGNVILMLVFTALLSLVLGMGLPTTANYIVVASLMAPVVVQLGSEAGLVVELIAVHLFVFYFGIMADVTPPVGLASFAAAAVSGGDPIRTGVTAFFYSLRTVLLPFIFIFNTQLLLIDVAGPLEFTLVVAAGTAGLLVFAAALQGYMVTHSRVWERLALLLVAFTLLRPGYFMEQIVPSMRTVDPSRIHTMAAKQPAGGTLRLVVEGMTIEGTEATKTVLIPLGDDTGANGAERLRQGAGLTVETTQAGVVVKRVRFGSPADKKGISLDWRVTALQVPGDQPPKQLFYIPALLLLGGIYANQRRRQKLRGQAARTAVAS
ncbi:TRAP transporter, 4TM/12TM fusion protein [Limimonas halophila]|uniref:TRAP transporter, 4TM/12TM fusion protein n=1 Tax=Limimonas halophila TaxID=1082479 RepID=A0A1G7LXV2_9PROT|nr:TRAP transporter permease [Limimonas halophila]SDF54221.1 TRAP transporter, 4TM/12TM fusion protein [Limimonas halophila]